MAQSAQIPSLGRESTDIRSQSNPLEASALSPNHQKASGASSSSWLSQKGPVSSDLLDLSQGSLSNVKTPSTSVSNQSSQEHAGIVKVNDINFNTSGYRIDSQERPQPTQLPAARASEHRVHYANAPKRMADGELKSPEYSLPTSPVSASQYGHSRNSSRTSRSSQISELSSQLKTRLSYALVKMQHGWQSHNIDELEQLTSNQVSPTSAASGQRGSRINLIADSSFGGNPHSKHSAFPTSAKTEYIHGPPQSAIFSPIDSGYQHKETYDQHHLARAGIAYDSFWREDERSGSHTANQPQSFAAEGPSLAPPVDILPSHPRRPDPTSRHPPALRTNDLYNPQGQLLPKTPSPKKSSKMRTPSQQAAVEKDAVESLLFMSSPGNTEYHPLAAPSGTLLRNDLTPQGAYALHHGLPASNEGQGNLNISLSTSDQQRPTLKRSLVDSRVDKMLDEMPDTSSSEDGDPQQAST